MDLTKADRKLIKASLFERLPESLKSLTEPFNGRERDIVLLSSIGVLSNCLPNVYGFYDGDMVYPHVYVIIIAPPASGKGVMNHSRLLIQKIHDKVIELSRFEKEQCEAENKKNKKSGQYNECPDMEIKILPANISTSEMYSYLNSSANGLLIMESEADTMSNMLKNDWSNYSDVLRKGFHHEPISISRKVEQLFVEINEPKLAMVISGTPDQLQPLIQSKDNGLFSRFIVYNFDEIADFKNVFEIHTRNIKEVFQDVGNDIFELYGLLRNINNPIEFKFTDVQQRHFLKRFRLIRNDIINNHSDSFLSNLNRHGLIMFRLCMILTVLRNMNNLQNIQEIVCSNKDFVSALAITQQVLAHAQFTFNTIDNQFLSLLDEAILDELPSSFNRQKAIVAAEKHNMPKRTLDDKLVQWQKKRIIKKESKGNYKKI